VLLLLFLEGELTISMESDDLVLGRLDSVPQRDAFLLEGFVFSHVFFLEFFLSGGNLLKKVLFLLQSLLRKHEHRVNDLLLELFLGLLFFDGLRMRKLTDTLVKQKVAVRSCVLVSLVLSDFCAFESFEVQNVADV